MKPTPPTKNYYYRLLIAVLGLASLFVSTALFPAAKTTPWVALFIVFFVAFLANFPLDLLSSEITLVQVVTLGGGLLYGPVTVAWAVAFGLLLGNLNRQLHSENRSRKPLLTGAWWLDTGFSVGLNIIPLLIVLPILGWVDGIAADPQAIKQVWTVALVPALAFAGLHGVLFMLGFSLRRRRQTYDILQRDLVSLAIVEFLPLPLVFLSIEVSPFIGARAITAMGGLLAIIAVLMSSMSTARSAHERRVRELSTLNFISQTLRSTLDLKDLLLVIQQQVTQLLGVDNFYVALYDRDTEELWYPLAVKSGERQNWERRPMADRLTDRVIWERKPLLLTPHTQAGPNPVGLPPSEETPASWLGVPLIVSERAIGCLAVSELTTGVEFTPEDIDLLTILSGQVSVVIDNALLFEQAQHRTTQLETLNRLTGAITASLNPQEVLAQVCGSVSLVGGGQRSAVFLLNPGEDEVWLAYAHGLTEGFSHRHQKFSIARSKRTRCLRTGQPVIIPNIQISSLSVELVQLFRADGIRAFADFPLITPDGQIGFLSVFFDDPHVFHREEIELLQTFASQAALAVSNARLHEVTDAQLSRRVQQLAILEAVGRELSAATHSDQLFGLILDYALEFTHSICGEFVLYHPDTNVLEVKASRGYQTIMDTFPADHGIAGRVVLTRQTVNVDDVSVDPDFIDIRNGESRSQLSVPIIHENKVLGVITLESSELNAFDESEQSLVVQLANQSAISLQNAYLFSDATHGRDRLSAIINSVGEGILMVNTHGQIMLVNEPIYTFSGVPLDQLLETQLSDLPERVMQVLGYTRHELALILDELGSGQVPSADKTKFQVPDSTSVLRVLARETSPVLGQDGRVLGWMIVLRDETEEYEISQTREIITETLVHDLSSPMSAVIGALDLIEEAFSSEDRNDFVGHSLRVAQRGAQRVIDLIEALLEIARLQSGRMDLKLAPMKLSSATADLLGDFTLMANKYGISILNEIPSDLPILIADQDKIIRVIMNLLDNAVKFTPEGGQVRVSASLLSDEMISVRIEDTGSGIPAEYQEKIFERFSQVPGQRGRRRGSGLGLAFCRLAVEAHGGNIRVESPPEGGSVFAFTLPVGSILD
ncbi:MAG: GAF domain-containing protein [Chloroflexi bacterium]|nr:GAF domain-containing protein [Chloroflexota bacterium]